MLPVRSANLRLSVCDSADRRACGALVVACETMRALHARPKLIHGTALPWGATTRDNTRLEGD